MRTPAHHTAETFKNMDCQTEVRTPDGGKWVMARPEPYYHWTARFKLAWLVFTGRADAVTWIGQ